MNWVVKKIGMYMIAQKGTNPRKYGYTFGDSPSFLRRSETVTSIGAVTKKV